MGNELNHTSGKNGLQHRVDWLSASISSVYNSTNIEETSSVHTALDLSRVTMSSDNNKRQYRGSGALSDCIGLRPDKS